MIFKVLTAAINVVGTLGSLIVAFQLHEHGVSGGVVVGVATSGILGSIVAAAAVSFFACVLDLLMAINRNTYAAIAQRAQQPLGERF